MYATTQANPKGIFTKRKKPDPKGYMLLRIHSYGTLAKAEL